MPEINPPVTFTFHNHKEADSLVAVLEQAEEQVIWEMRSTKDERVIVSILNVIDKEDEEVSWE